MSEQQRPQLRLYLTGLVLLAEGAHLTWEHFHGGVVSHHILHRSDMPAISNWWGVLLLPALTWFLTGRIQKRLALDSAGKGTTVVLGFVGSLLYGILLAVSFTNHFESIASYLFQGMLLLAILLPVYRAECVLGFVLGMAFTFGAVLPTVAGSIIGAVSAVMHLAIRPGLVRLWNSLKRKLSRSA
ncbi:MAG: hypothetical protein M3Z54_06985 [Gemmatimonadota bacterium]|nr:hypothetical protein [Gemmatimonadota bacterium]